MKARRISLNKIARDLNRRSATVEEASNHFERAAIREAAEEKRAAIEAETKAKDIASEMVASVIRCERLG